MNTIIARTKDKKNRESKKSFISTMERRMKLRVILSGIIERLFNLSAVVSYSGPWSAAGFRRASSTSWLGFREVKPGTNKRTLIFL